MVQYMEQKILQCRQLIPVMSDILLIKKLARHYDQSIQYAVVTCGVQTINNFETLLQEFMAIQARDRYEGRSDTMN